MRHTVSEITLSNGGKGLLVHVPNASVMTFDINFRAGEFLVESDKCEVPHLMEHMVLGANELIPKSMDFQAELERNGAYSNASTSAYDITYEAECADFEWDRVFDLLLVAITRPLFLEDEFKAEYGNVQEEMAARSNNHFRNLSLAMLKEQGLLAKTDAEHLKLMHNVSLEDIRAHYKRTHTSQNMRFVIAGNITSRRQEHIQNVLSMIDLPRDGRRYLLPHETPKPLKQSIYIRNKSVENLYFYIDTFMKRRLSDPEADALHLVNTMLTDTLYSKIFGTARERGLVYSMSSGLSHTRNASNWWFGAQVSDKNAPALMNIIRSELRKVMDGAITIEDIKATKQYSLGRFQRSAQTVSGTSMGYTGRYFFDGVIEDYYNIPARIEAVDKDMIVDIARLMFSDNLWGLGILGNCGKQYCDQLRNQILPLWENPINR
ncbi:MAG: M16 family metallopeptidase [Candidatus Saccharimonadales bacterium]